MQQILRINRDTLFKLRPDQASELAPNEAYRVTAGTVYDIQSYAYANAQRDFNNHIKFALKNTSIQGFNTWFVSTLDAQVEFDGKVVYPLEDQVTLPTLRINTDTVLKRRPLQSEVLSDNERYEVKRGQSFDLHSYAYADASGDFSSHIKFALRNERDYIRGFSTWFVYDQHGYVVFDDRVVYPPEDPNTPILKVTQDTLFKKRPLPSSQLGADEVYAVPDGGTWVLHSYAYADASGDFNNHIKIALKYEKDFVQYLSTWFIYDRHAQIEINGNGRLSPAHPDAHPNARSDARSSLHRQSLSITGKPEYILHRSTDYSRW
ncbi:MAG: hypothetical protein HC881_01650 [Leptolyngbyaceae cyanobacterium SL_7_1]|nr:hypothetical protein [Leptolyngbyaceae cyanobacterium SL_7_1]